VQRGAREEIDRVMIAVTISRMRKIDHLRMLFGEDLFEIS